MVHRASKAKQLCWLSRKSQNQAHWCNHQHRPAAAGHKGTGCPVGNTPTAACARQPDHWRQTGTQGDKHAVARLSWAFVKRDISFLYHTQAAGRKSALYRTSPPPPITLS